MKLLYDGRVLNHKHSSGVEVYTKSLYEALLKIMHLELVVPPCKLNYCQHFWEHVFLPLKSASFDILFCPANIAPLWVPKMTKLVVTLHDVGFLRYPQSVSKLFGMYYRWVIPKILNRADAIVTISESSRLDILKYYPQVQSKLYVIHNGIDNKFVSIDHDLKKRMILYVGSLQERKNFISVVKAFNSIQNQLDDYELVVIGRFSNIFSLTQETQKILDDARRDKYIHFIDSVSEDTLAWYYRHASLFVFPSFYEGFGFPPLEAMASGTPVVTSNLSSMPEICGDAAVYVDPYDVNDIAEKMHKVLINDEFQKELIQKGLSHVKKFTWDNCAREYKVIFEKVIN